MYFNWDHLVGRVFYNIFVSLVARIWNQPCHMYIIFSGYVKVVSWQIDYFLIKSNQLFVGISFMCKCLSGKRALTPKDSAFVVRQTLKVAAKCHLLGLTHRDMIPVVGMIWTTLFEYLYKFFIIKYIAFHVVGRNLCLQNSTSRPAHVLIRETQVLMRAKLIGLDLLHTQNHRPLPPQSNQETYLTTTTISSIFVSL